MSIVGCFGHGSADGQFNTNPKRQRGKPRALPRWRFGLVWKSRKKALSQQFASGFRDQFLTAPDFPFCIEIQRHVAV